MKRHSGVSVLLGLAACGVGIVGVWASLWHGPDLLAAAPRYLATYGAAFGLYLGAVTLQQRGAAGRSTDSARYERACLTVVLAGALAMRLTVWPLAPTLTTDFHRYLWDGRVAAAGINPYRYAPRAPALQPLRAPGWERINFPGTRTPYPPFSQICFWFVARFLGGSVGGLKLVLAAFDLGLLVGLTQLLRTRQRPMGDVIVYAWHPLVVSEVALSAHQDVIGLGLLVAGVALLQASAVRRQPSAMEPLGTGSAGTRSTGRLAAGAAALGLSIAAKGFTLLLLPRLARGHGRLVAGVALATTAALYLPYLGAMAALQRGALSMARHWDFNGSFVPALALLFHTALPLPPATAALTARVLAGLLILGASLWIGGRGVPTRCRGGAADAATADPLPRDLYLLLMVLLLASPVVMPWYVLWLVPWLCFHRAPSGFVFSLLVPLSYLVSTDRFPPWLQAAEYLPVYALLAWELLKLSPPTSPYTPRRWRSGGCGRRHR